LQAVPTHHCYEYYYAESNAHPITDIKIPQFSLPASPEAHGQSFANQAHPPEALHQELAMQRSIGGES
jgi:hypothetical protein